MADTTLRAIITGSSAGAVKAFDEAALSSETSSTKISGAIGGAEGKVTGAFASMGHAVQNFTGIPVGTAMDKLSGKMKGTASEGSSAFQKLSSVGGGALLGIGAGLAVVGGASVKMAADFQTQMTSLVTGAGESQKNIGQVSSGILAMAGSVGTSTTDLANGMYLIESAGFHGAQGLTVLQAAAEGAKVGNADLKTVADGVTTALTDYHMKAGDATAVTDMLVKSVASGKTTMGDLTGSLSAVMPTAAAAKVGIEQVLGAMSTMTGQGISAQQAAQNLNGAIQALQNPSSTQVAEMEQLGLSANKVALGIGDDKGGLTNTYKTLVGAITSKMGPAGTVILDSFKKSEAAAGDAKLMLDKMPPTLQAVAEKFQAGTITQKEWRATTKGLTVDQKEMAQQFATTVNKTRGFNDQLKSGGPSAQTFTAALSKLTGGQTGLATALALTGSHAGTFQTNVQGIIKTGATATGTVTGMAAVHKDLNFQLSQAKEGAKAMAISFGDILIPKLEVAIHIGVSLANMLMKHKALAEGLAAVIGGVLAVAIGAFAINMGVKMVKSIQSAGKAIGGLVKKIPEFIGGLGEAEAAEEEFGTTSETVGEESSMAFGPIGLAIMAIVAIGVLLMTHWGTVKRYLSAAWQTIKAEASAVWGAIKKVFEDVINAIKTVFLNFTPEGQFIKHWQTIKADAVAAWNDIVGFFTSIPSRIMGALSSLGSLIANFATNIWHGFLSAVQTGEAALYAYFIGIPKKVLGWLGDAGKWLLNIGENVIHGLVRGIENGVGWIKDAMGKIVDKLKSFITNPLSIFSPSKVFDGYGQNIMQGLAQGITSASGLATDAVGNVAALIANTQIGVPSLTAGSAAGIVGSGISGTGATATSGVSSAGRSAPQINVNVQTGADPHAIANEVGWVLRTAPVS